MPNRLRKIVFYRREKKKLFAAIKMQSAWRGIRERKRLLANSEKRMKLERVVAMHSPSPSSSPDVDIPKNSTLAKMMSANTNFKGKKLAICGRKR